MAVLPWQQIRRIYHQDVRAFADAPKLAPHLQVVFEMVHSVGSELLIYSVLVLSKNIQSMIQCDFSYQLA